MSLGDKNFILTSLNKFYLFHFFDKSDYKDETRSLTIYILKKTGFKCSFHFESVINILNTLFVFLS